MQSANEWLLAQGHIAKVTRGRRSAENTQRLTEAYAAGTRFRDFEPVEKTNRQGATVTVNKVKAGSNSEIDNFAAVFIRYAGPTGTEAGANEVWTVSVAGKILPTPNGHGGLKEICHNCRYSLVGHTCNNPEIIYEGRIVPVTIAPRR